MPERRYDCERSDRSTLWCLRVVAALARRGTALDTDYSPDQQTLALLCLDETIAGLKEAGNA